jgi:hypothetical protein
MTADDGPVVGAAAWVEGSEAAKDADIGQPTLCSEASLETKKAASAAAMKRCKYARGAFLSTE